ncbi:MAG: NAD-dependent DNA ligase LigA [Treponema sp.]|nr:NAD-dependent DNA ligase LigA [Treponema sp.]
MKDKDERIAVLAGLVEKYQDSYYSGETEITDAEFDLLWDELKGLDPDHPLLKKVGRDSVDGFPKAKHLIPMGSQEKAATPDEFRAWAKKVRPASFVVQHKLDGASLELQYENGKLKKAVTRGDGITGDDITRNARRMAGVVAEISGRFSGGVRGEVVMTLEVFKEKYSDKANCRNAANGIMRRKDGEGCQNLRYIGYDAASSGDDAFFKTEMEKIAWLETQGFTPAETKECSDAEEVILYRAEIAEKRKGMSLDIDGLVVKDFFTDMADLRRPRPQRQIAFKFEPEVAYTILRSVQWSESGAAYTPVGIVDPVRLAGTTVQRANLNNPDMIRAMGLEIGSAVSVVKLGEIIPKIEGLAPAGLGLDAAVKTEIVFPLDCAACGSVLEDGGTRLFCPNPACSKRLHHRLEKWVSVLDIRELGDKLLRQLFDSGRVREISDLYTLTEGELTEFERMGELSAAKVARHINTRREISLSAFVAGFNLEGVGELVMEKAVSAGFDTLEKLRAASVEELSGVYGLGEVTATVIAAGLKECATGMDKVLATGVIAITAPPPPENVPLKGLSFCFTGELKKMKRAQAGETVKARGGSVKPSVVKDLSYLVTNDPDSGSSKNEKARELGVTIIDEDAFWALLEGGTPSAGQGELF